MITIYLPATSPRITYVISHIFRMTLGIEFICTADKEAFLAAPGWSLNYSGENLRKGVWIQPHPIMYESGVKEQTIVTDRWNDLPCFFLQPGGDIPFDLFAASFYLITRYEEYLHQETDAHGRFPAEQSLAYKEDFLEIPLVDRWTFLLAGMLLGDGEDYECAPRSFRIVSTFDIDHPYLYRNKGLIKNIVGGIKDLRKKDRSSLKERIRTMLHLQPDPYFSAIKDIQTLHKKHGHEYFLFIHVGKYGKHDRRTLYPHRSLYSHIRSLHNVRLGLHPSYKVSFSYDGIRREKKKLEMTLIDWIGYNRQHFLRMRFPETYRILDELEFIGDFSLAYASHPGFRASTSIPFHFFDLESNVKRNLLVHPTIVMDTTFIDHQKMSPERAVLTMKILMLECYAAGGDFTMLWHNSNLSHAHNNVWFDALSEILAFGLDLEEAGWEGDTDHLHLE